MGRPPRGVRSRRGERSYSRAEDVAEVVFVTVQECKVLQGVKLLVLFFLQHFGKEKKSVKNSPTTTLLKCRTALRFRGRKREKKGLASKLKGLRPPGPGEMVDGYFASEFHQKNFKQPLVSRARQEDQV